MTRKLRLFIAFALMVPLVGAVISGPPSVAAPSPFRHGVAAYGGSTDAILWTRVNKAGRVRYQVATDGRFTKTVARGAIRAVAGNDFTVKPHIAALRPGRAYFYRFTFGQATSPTGRFRTLLAPTATGGFDFALSGDSDKLWTEYPDPQPRPFSVLDRIREENPDFFIYLGDTIYSDSETEAPTALTLQEKWAKYRANRLPATKGLMGSVSTWAGWDDHEVINDYDGAVLAQTDPALLTAGQEAFWDYMPVLEDEFYRNVPVGDDAEFFFLDERTFRSQSGDEPDSPCRSSVGGPLDLAPTMPQSARDLIPLPPVDPDCLTHIFDPTRTMLGAEQKAWLKAGLLASGSTWKFIVNQVPITQAFALPYDRWEGYAAERNELLDFIRDNNVKNVVFLTTDIHANFLGPVYRDITQSRTAVAYEIVTGPIQTCELDCEVDAILGSATAGEEFLQLLRFANLIDVDCVDIDSYGYAHVTVPAEPTSISVQLRGAQKERGGGGPVLENCDRTLNAVP
jgi:phosphodiesterase/alkaline phosphatase D-like protein